MDSSFRYFALRVTGMILFLALPLISFAQSETPLLSGGANIDSAGTVFTEAMFGQTLKLENHLKYKEKIYIALPPVKPGQGLHLEARAQGFVRYETADSDVIQEESGDDGNLMAVIVDESDEELCNAHSRGNVREECFMNAFSSDKTQYQLYLVVEGTSYNDRVATHKNAQITLSIVEQYDTAITDDKDDVPNVIVNALQIAPGEYSGFITEKDEKDFYRIDGIADEATMSITISPTSDNEVIGSLIIQVYDQNRRKIDTDTLRAEMSEIANDDFQIDFENENKTTRYVEVVSGVYSNKYSVAYSLSIEIQGYNAGGSAAGVGCAGFSDVAVTDLRCPAVTKMKEKGIMQGTDAGLFEGTRVLNRAEFAAVILRFMNEQAYDNASLGNLSTMKDVEDRHKGRWWVGTMRKAVELNIIQGFDDGTLRASDPTERAQFVVIFMRGLGVTPPVAAEKPANDVKIGRWYTDAVKYVVENNLFNLDFSNNFYPNQPITRFEAADLLYRHFNR